MQVKLKRWLCVTPASHTLRVRSQSPTLITSLVTTISSQVFGCHPPLHNILVIKLCLGGGISEPYIPWFPWALSLNYFPCAEPLHSFPVPHAQASLFIIPIMESLIATPFHTLKDLLSFHLTAYQRKQFILLLNTQSMCSLLAPILRSTPFFLM